MRMRFWQRLLLLTLTASSLLHSPAVWPFSKMRDWILTVQRNNKVNRGAKNEPVVPPRGVTGPRPGWIGSLYNFRNISKDINLSMIGRRRLRNTCNHLCQRCVHLVADLITRWFTERYNYEMLTTWGCRFHFDTCNEARYTMHHLQRWASTGQTVLL